MPVLCTRLSVTVKKSDLENVREMIKTHYNADRVLLSYEIHE